MIRVNSSVIELAIRELSYSAGSFLGNDIYYEKKFVDMMINIIGEDNLVEMLKKDNSDNKKRNNELGENWYKPDGMKYQLKRFDRVVEKTKTSYDLLEDPTLKKKDLKFSDFSEKAKYLPLIKEDFRTLFVFFLLLDPLTNYSLDKPAMKVMENKGYKHIENFDKRRVGNADGHKEE